MCTYQKVALLDNEIQAHVLEGMLRKHKIPHRMFSFYDSAYQENDPNKKGWGYVTAPTVHKQKIRAFVRKIKANPSF